MTVFLEQHETDKYYVSIAVERRYNREIYVVHITENVGGLYGYPMLECTYPISEKKKAYATYRRYIRKYCK